MGLFEVVLLPAAAAVALGWLLAAIARGQRGRRARRIAAFCLAAVTDAWLCLVAYASPLGPHAWLAVLVILANFGIVVALVQDLTGFVYRGRGLDRTGYRSSSAAKAMDYDGYRAD